MFIKNTNFLCVFQHDFENIASKKVNNQTKVFLKRGYFHQKKVRSATIYTRFLHAQAYDMHVFSRALGALHIFLTQTFGDQ